VLKPELK